jgi:hypothetical protein
LNYRQQILGPAEQIVAGGIIQRNGPDKTEVFVMSPTGNDRIFDCLPVWSGEPKNIPPYMVILKLADDVLMEANGG